MAVRLYGNLRSLIQNTARNLKCSDSKKGIATTAAVKSDGNECGEDSKDSGRTAEFPEEPTNCCMSGCANCVWIKYAEQLMKQFDVGSDVAKKLIFDKVQDPNMRAFLELELRTMAKR